MSGESTLLLNNKYYIHNLSLGTTCEEVFINYINRLTAIDANWRQTLRALKRRGIQLASWILDLSLMLICHEEYQLGP